MDRLRRRPRGGHHVAHLRGHLLLTSLLVRAPALPSFRREPHPARVGAPLLGVSRPVDRYAVPEAMSRRGFLLHEGPTARGWAQRNAACVSGRQYRVDAPQPRRDHCVCRVHVHLALLSLLLGHNKGPGVQPLDETASRRYSALVRARRHPTATVGRQLHQLGGGPDWDGEDDLREVWIHVHHRVRGADAGMAFGASSEQNWQAHLQR
mmetsp:Transcript_15328/g.33310  ORF Transcript_15328/g.33310 Transcript_15328/m.33310 type:complete len:208 (-) Transcript_15328:86-709(-)